MFNLYLARVIFVTAILQSWTNGQSFESNLKVSSGCQFLKKENKSWNQQETMKCCNESVKSFYLKWSNGKRSLSSFLHTLKVLNCPQFEMECERQTFNYTKFTELVYIKFCNDSTQLLEDQCRDSVYRVVRRQSDNNLPSSISWKKLLSHLDTSTIEDEELLDPCLQLAMLEKSELNQEKFIEIIDVFVPFCSFIWCGFSEQVFTSRSISVWTCMQPNCHSNIIVVAVACALLAIATTVCNGTVLAVLFTNKKLMNGQSVYKISIAIADLLVGIIVFPTFISTFTQLLLGKLEPYGDPITEIDVVSNLAISNTTASKSYIYNETIGNSTTYTSSQISNNSRSIFTGSSLNVLPQAYFDAVGFFTTLSLTVSVYTLVAAAVDRFIAIHRPMKYHQSSPMSTARKASVLIWIIGIVFSVLPLFIPDLAYKQTSPILISSAGHASLVVYLLAFLLPLIVMWVVTIATQFTFNKHNKARKVLHTSSQTSRRSSSSDKISVETRLATTLGIMVGVFTLCVLPVGILLAMPFALTSILTEDPANLDQQTAINFMSAEVVITIVLTTNSLWNFFIYNGRDHKFRKATKAKYLSLFYSIRSDESRRNSTVKMNS